MILRADELAPTHPPSDFTQVHSLGAPTVTFSAAAHATPRFPLDLYDRHTQRLHEVSTSQRFHRHEESKKNCDPSLNLEKCETKGGRRG